ncbi:AEX-3 domain-containing protein [Hyaloraphidium curvatum]|nr:AEX-3 domain-containing protein [Hyaloraphidium curvatum]
MAPDLRDPAAGGTPTPAPEAHVPLPTVADHFFAAGIPTSCIIEEQIALPGSWGPAGAGAGRDADLPAARRLSVSPGDQARLGLPVTIGASAARRHSRTASLSGSGRRLRRPVPLPALPEKVVATEARSAKSSAPGWATSLEISGSVDSIGLRHPGELKLHPETLFVHGSKSQRFGFPQWTALFCFPNDVSVRFESEPEPPPLATHSFVLTDCTGEEVHGTCLTLWEKPEASLRDQIARRIESWREANMTPAEREHADSLLSSIRSLRRQLASLRAEIAALPAAVPDSLTRRPNLLAEPNSNPFVAAAQASKRRAMLEEGSELEERISLAKEVASGIGWGLFDADCAWIPRCIGLLKRGQANEAAWYGLHRDWLLSLATRPAGGPPAEVWAAQLLDGVPLPPRGVCEVQLELPAGQTVFLTRPPWNRIPVLRNFPLHDLSIRLPHSLIASLLPSLLLSRTLLLLSSHAAALAPSIAALRALMFPFEWPWPCVPVLPRRMWDYLEAPVPWIVGAVREGAGSGLFAGLEGIEGHVPADAVVVDLDSGAVRFPRDGAHVELPPHERDKLMARLDELVKLDGLGLPPTSLAHAYGESLALWSDTRSKSGAAPASSPEPQRSDQPGFKESAGDQPAGPTRPNLASVDEEPDASPPAPSPSPHSSCTHHDLGGFDGHGRHVLPPPTSSHPARPRLRRSLSRSSTSLTIAPPARGFLSSLFSRNTGDRRTSDGLSPLNADLLPSPNERALGCRVLGPGGSMALVRGLSEISVSPVREGTAESGSLEALGSGSGGGSRTSLGEASAEQQIEAAPSTASAAQEHVGDARHAGGHELLDASPDTTSGTCSACGLPLPDVGLKCAHCPLLVHPACTAHLACRPCPRAFDPRRVQEAFLRVFTSLFKDYRRFMESDRGDGVGFRAGEFLAASRPEARPFLAEFLGSQQFSELLRRARGSHPDTAFFDAAVAAKRNRSRLKLARQDVGLLRDGRFAVGEARRVPPPPHRERDPVADGPAVPASFDPELFVRPGSAPPALPSIEPPGSEGPPTASVRLAPRRTHSFEIAAKPSPTPAGPARILSGMWDGSGSDGSDSGDSDHDPSSQW